MSRIIKPLTGMGGRLSARGNNQYLPMTIVGSPLKGIDYQSPVASAQVKSCMMLAGLYAEGVTRITEPALSRDHTERMLTYLGGSFHRDGLTLSIQGTQSLKAKPIRVPGDISSAAFFIAAGLIVKGSEIVLENVGLNPTRTGILDAVRSMGGQFEFMNEIGKDWEPSGNIRIQFSHLKAAEFGGALIPRIIDEIPILAVLATQAEGITVIKDAQELKVKETNRIDAVVNELTKMGARIEGRDDGLVIEGPTPLKGAQVQSYGDHRMAMSLAIAGLIAEGETLIEDTECIHTSFPNFMDLLQGLKG
jgi:3-phosphoshikimate 1-carboxyvinyltransferase